MYIEPIYLGSLMYSSLIVLLSIGLTLTFLTTKVPNFAHGSFATIGIYVALTMYRVLKAGIYYSLPISFVVAGTVAVMFYLFVLRPLIKGGANIIVQMVATIALDIMLVAGISIYADYLTKVYKVTSRWFYLREADFFVSGWQGVLIVAPLLVVATVLLLNLLLTRTKFGIAMRAIIENPDLAGTIGVNVNLVYTVSWFLAGGLAGMAGSLFPLRLIGNPDTGVYLIITVFAASIAGGFYNIYGGLIGGYVVGLAEVLGTALLASGLGSWVIPYRPAIPLVIMIAVLLLAPRGITGILARREVRGGL